MNNMYNCPICGKSKSSMWEPCDCLFSPLKMPSTFKPVPLVEVEELKASDTQTGGNHYKTMAIQPAEFCQKNKLDWCESNVIKYVCRHKDKNGVEDINKAIHYLELLKEWNYNE